MLNTKNEGKRGVLRVRLVGDADNSRADVHAALTALGDPPLELVEADAARRR